MTLFGFDFSLRGDVCTQAENWIFPNMFIHKNNCQKFGGTECVTK